MSRTPHKMIGKQFGSLFVISETEDSLPRTKKFNVKCMSCSRLFFAHGSNIRRHGKKNLPGCQFCYTAEPKNPQFKEKHGLWNHPLYGTWAGINTRCYDKRHIRYHRYGGRGISVCDEWKNNPAQFIAWMIKENWKQGLEIDRRDNDGNYTPDNCRVVSRQTNANNKSNNHRITIHNQTMTISQASRKYKINKSTIRERIQRQWSGDDLVRFVR